MYHSHIVAFLRITWFFHQKVQYCNKELVDCLDIIMREVVNAYKGIKEPMHVIMEEDAVYEQSIIMSQSNLSDMENFPGMDASAILTLWTPSTTIDTLRSCCCCAGVWLGLWLLLPALLLVTSEETRRQHSGRASQLPAHQLRMF